MKNLLKVFVFIQILIFNTNAIAQKNVEGNEKMISKIFTTETYNSIEIIGSMEIVLIKDQIGKINVTAESKIIDFLSIESIDENLKITFQNNISLKNVKNVRIEVPYEKLSKISLVGSGSIAGTETIQSKNLEINLQGSGSIDLVIETESTDAKLNGSGTMDLEGNSTNLDIKTTGSGSYNGKKLITDNTDVFVSGSGAAQVYAKQRLKARVQGSGSITYSGNPMFKDIKVLGSGKINRNL
ncbi:head GIN domain-containing protein [Aequorivita echinoideorum]|uniref:DUF2807 domain-containing protein n=1 Tax=Aequorivita echinoideorum TaxID=1549647 RepID=A0ABS5S6E2_9FLAO|nr:head GIN domain-containing protein [Aequorivita echinoideorum]MBT0608767.1 DUF2807 domain-containing protein [Aequorivita echinoideorum]